ncbi:hypothetical protein Nepgr_001687 [Nepenthes gracilis]|uniref:Uncharacterized protein n=1 Tax=Nepenthes gracilis TaxID=150966 RepID=A0AAD3P5J1_NEPGR|nr:hypothetical protein Nepgr_001687 [Nepenthes gracilis]
MQEDKKTKLKKGSLAVQVGLEGEDIQKFVIPISYLHHPLFSGLLDKAREVYGYHADGPLRLPCSPDDFLHLRWQIEKEDGGRLHHVHRDHHYHHFHRALSFRSC